MAENSDEKTKLAPRGSGVVPDDPRTRVLPAATGVQTEDKTKVLSEDKTKASSGDETTRLMPRTSSAPAQSPADEKTVALERQPSAPDVKAGGADATVRAAVSTATDEDETVIRTRPAGRPRLLARDAGGSVREIALDKPDITIGRANSCDMVLANPEVSRQHARIVERDGTRILIVTGARRNTLVNSEPISGERALRHGDVLELASERLVYADAEDTPAFEGVTIRRLPPGALAVAIGVIFVAGAVLAFSLFGRSTPSGSSPGEGGAPPGEHGAPGAGTLAAKAKDAALEPKVESPDSAAPRAALPAPDPAAAREEERRRTEAQLEEERRRTEAQREEERQQRVRKLLYEGDIAFLENRLTAPTEGSASYAYSEILKLDPTNERALGQIAAIIDKYLGWAEAARGRGDRRLASLYAEKATYLHGQVPAAGEAATIDRRLEALRAR